MLHLVKSTVMSGNTEENYPLYVYSFCDACVVPLNRQKHQNSAIYKGVQDPAEDIRWVKGLSAFCFKLCLPGIPGADADGLKDTQGTVVPMDKTLAML